VRKHHTLRTHLSGMDDRRTVRASDPGTQAGERVR
jgi:hypothetical protein